MICQVLIIICLVCFADGWMTPIIRHPNGFLGGQSRVLLRSQLSTTATDNKVEVNGGQEKFKFESNVSRVMDIIINSLYSNKDVFLRELISNAADACDKRRFMMLKDKKYNGDLKIQVYPNRERNSLVIEDRGIGMNKLDLIQNLGRIAESGTKKFNEVHNEENDKEALSLIGQFGVGFYSGFLVAKKIVVTTKSNNEEQLRWEASADSLGEYTISPDDSEPIEGSGTRIELFLKDENDQYLDDIALKALIEKYSEFTPFPIELQRNVSRPESVPDTSAVPGPDGTIPMKTVMKRVYEWIVVNEKKPLWLRQAKNCSEEEYDDFYKQTFKAFDKPLAHSHFAVEGNVDFKALLYLPSELPYELTRDMFSSSARSMRLYVKRVFINDKFEDLIPRWLLFLRGVVDSEDLPLNVGREILQQSRALRIIRQRLVKKSIDMIAGVAMRNETEYDKFWKNFGKYIRVGVIEDEKFRDDLVPLCRFYSSNSEDTLTSLTDYVKRMKADQKYIFYIVGETRAQAAMSPALEAIRQKGYEVLYISDPLDEMTLANIEKFSEKQIMDVGKEFKEDLSEKEKKEKKNQNEDLEGLRNWVKEVLGNKITRVEASTRLFDSPAMIVQSEYGVSPNMQKYLKSQSVVEKDQTGQFSDVFNQAVLELNPSHPIIQGLKRMYEEDPKAPEACERVNILFNTAALAAGYVLDNAADYSQMIVRMMTKLAQ